MEDIDEDQRVKLKELDIESMIFLCMINERNDASVKIKCNKKWGKKIEAIVPWIDVLDEFWYFYPKEVHILSFIDIWEMKRTGKWTDVVK